MRTRPAPLETPRSPLDSRQKEGRTHTARADCTANTANKVHKDYNVQIQGKTIVQTANSAETIAFISDAASTKQEEASSRNEATTKHLQSAKHGVSPF